MKGYGLPRTLNLQYPDLGDINAYCLKSAAGNLRGKGGDIRSGHKNSNAKRAGRRIFKRRARAAGKAACRIED